MALFIGGCLDGKHIALKPGTQRFAGSAFTAGMPAIPAVNALPVSECIRRDHYRKARFSGDDGYEPEIFMLEGKTESDVMRALVTGYKKP